MNNNPSIEKNLRMLALVAKKDFMYQDDKKIIGYKAPEAVYLSPTFFREFKCQQCSWCCIRATLEYYPFQLDMLKGKPIEKDLKKEVFTINGLEKHILAYDQLDHSCKKCKYLEPTSCTIHDHHSFNCRFEPIKMRKKGNKGIIYKTYPGRKWVKRNGISAQCTFLEYNNYQMQMNDIPLLEEMIEISNYLGIETWLPELVYMLKNNPNLPLHEAIEIGRNK